MSQSTITPTPTAVSPVVHLDEARRVVAEALLQHAATSSTSAADAALALTMAQNVTGWTHTTRLREFLAAVTR